MCLSSLQLSSRNSRTRNDDFHRQRACQSRESCFRRHRPSRSCRMRCGLDLCSWRVLRVLPVCPRILSGNFTRLAGAADDPSSYQRLLGLQCPSIFRIGSGHFAFVSAFVCADFFWAAVSLSLEKSLHRRGRRNSAQQNILPQHAGLHCSKRPHFRDLDPHGALPLEMVERAGRDDLSGADPQDADAERSGIGDLSGHNDLCRPRLANVAREGLVFNHVRRDDLHRSDAKRTGIRNFASFDWYAYSAVRPDYLDRRDSSQDWEPASGVHHAMGLSRIRTTADHLVGKLAQRNFLVSEPCGGRLALDVCVSVSF